MKLIQIKDPFVTLDSKPYYGATLFKGKTYLLYKAYAQRIADLGLGRIIEGLEELPYFTQTELKYHSRPLKILFLFDGGLGDAITLKLFLNALETQYDIRANVACEYKILEDILRPMGFSGDWFRLPVEIEDIKSHDFIQIRADAFFADKKNKWDLCVIEELGRAYNVQIDDNGIHYSIPEDVLKKTLLHGIKGIRIGVNFESKGAIRSYPAELQPLLLNYLLGAGFEVFIFGLKSPNLLQIGEKSMVHDLCGKTGIAELAALIGQMDIMLCMDSFIAHLSNILNVKTVVLLSTTRKGVYNWHRNIRCLESMIDCSPCGEVGNKCPMGLSQCQAFYHESTAPGIVAFSIINECAAHYNQLIRSSFNGRG